MLELHQCTKFIKDGKLSRQLINLDRLKIDPGELHVCFGPSGSGKTTMLEVCGALTPLDRGDIYWCGNKIQHITDFCGDLCYVPVSSSLFNELSIEENMLFSLSMKGIMPTDSRDVIQHAIDAVNLSYLNKQLSPSHCSMGEKIRLSLCRALVQKPKLLLIDEPTANLDAALSEGIFELIKKNAKEWGMVVMVASHDPRALDYADHATEFCI